MRRAKVCVPSLLGSALCLLLQRDKVLLFFFFQLQILFSLGITLLHFMVALQEEFTCAMMLDKAEEEH